MCTTASNVAQKYIFLNFLQPLNRFFTEKLEVQEPGSKYDRYLFHT